MKIQEVIEILKRHHMWTGAPQEIIDVRTENEALNMAIRSLEAWDKVAEDIAEVEKSPWYNYGSISIKAIRKDAVETIKMIINQHMKEVE